MSSLTLSAHAFGPLTAVEWAIPPGVSVIVGPNRVGKSTLLALPEFLRLAIHEELAAAANLVFGGPAFLRTFGKLVSSVGMTIDDGSWDLHIGVQGSVFSLAEELYWQGAEILASNVGEVRLDERLALIGESLPKFVLHQARYAVGRAPDPVEALRQLSQVPANLALKNRDALLVGTLLATSVERFLNYRTYDYAVAQIQRGGSAITSGARLAPDGTNVFSVLRNWRDRSDTAPRTEFVLATLRELFPHVGTLELDVIGQSVVGSIRDRRWPDLDIPLARESTGLVTALLQLCAVVSTPRGGLVTIDEPETSLHPKAIQVLVSAFREWANQQDLRIVLATQSQTVLDQFHEEPEQVFVIEPGQSTSPVRLTDLFDVEYLNQFSLGALFSHLEFGSNREPPAGA